MATSISIMGSMNTGDLIQGLLSMGATLTALVVAAAALSAIGPGALVGSGALLVIAAALTLLMVPLTAFASMSLGQVATSLIMLGGALAIVIVAGGAAGADDCRNLSRRPLRLCALQDPDGSGMGLSSGQFPPAVGSHRRVAGYL